MRLDKQERHPLLQEDARKKEEVLRLEEVEEQNRLLQEKAAAKEGVLRLEKQERECLLQEEACKKVCCSEDEYSVEEEEEDIFADSGSDTNEENEDELVFDGLELSLSGQSLVEEGLDSAKRVSCSPEKTSKETGIPFPSY